MSGDRRMVVIVAEVLELVFGHHSTKEESTGMLPWVVVGRDGSEITFDTRDEWFSEWRRRIRVMEAADRPIAARREGLERALFVAADARLAARECHPAVGVVEVVVQGSSDRPRGLLRPLQHRTAQLVLVTSPRSLFPVAPSRCSEPHCCGEK